LDLSALETSLRTRLDQSQSAWLTEALRGATQGTVSQLLRAYTEASRILRDTPLAPRADEQHLQPLAHWSREDAGRLALLLTRHAHTTDAEQFATDAIACYEQGDTREQQSWMRGVAYLPDAERYLPLVVDTCRTNIVPLFQAVACDNPYPAQYFPELNFNQMVLKALFNSTPLARIERLSERANKNLARMAADYAAERRAAGRSVPADIDLAMTAGVVGRTDK
jgi:hypothetical protein